MRGFLCFSFGTELDVQHSMAWIAVFGTVIAAMMYIVHNFPHHIEYREADDMRKVASFRHHKIATQVMDLACNYNPVVGNSAVEKFTPVMRQSQCLFAKAAQCWGSAEFNPGCPLDINIERSLPMMLQFLERGEEEGLDAFIFEIRGRGKYFSNLEAFGKTVREVLATISKHDPKGRHCMMQKHIADSGWFFQFNGKPIFVTTFAPFYPESSSRFMFPEDCNKDSCFILLQPEYSFLNKNLENDSPDTNWDNPTTVRDRIRVNFRSKGRGYEIPKTVRYPPALHIVKPLDWQKTIRGGCPFQHQWWKV